MRQFDVVRILRVDNVKYLSGPPGRAASPKGEWSVVAFVEDEALLAKQSTIIRIPLPDIVRVAEYDLALFADRLKNVGGPSIDVVRSVSRMLNIAYDKALAICRKHEIPTRVDTKQYEQKALTKLKKAMNIKEINDG